MFSSVIRYTQFVLVFLYFLSTTFILKCRLLLVRIHLLYVH